MQVLWLNASLIFTLMLCVWIVSLFKRDASIIDPVWGFGFVLVSWNSWYHTDQGLRNLLPVLLTTLWGMRLSLYLLWRNIGEPEDYRYRAMREKHGSWFPLVSLGTVFILQGMIMWVVSLPVQLTHISSVQQAWWSAAGIILFSIGFLFEAIGDWQLGRFKADKKNQGKVLQTGLWAYTRHPNYFGDFCVWWGLYFVSLGGGAPWWTFVGPLVMSIFLMRISGVSLLEKGLTQSKPGYRLYAQNTNAFFPGLPKEKQRCHHHSLE